MDESLSLDKRTPWKHLPVHFRELMGAPQRTVVRDGEPGTHCHTGSQSALEKPSNNELLGVANMTGLQLHISGLHLFRSSKTYLDHTRMRGSPSHFYDIRCRNILRAKTTEVRQSISITELDRCPKASDRSEMSPRRWASATNGCYPPSSDTSIYSEERVCTYSWTQETPQTNDRTSSVLSILSIFDEHSGLSIQDNSNKKQPASMKTPRSRRSEVRLQLHRVSKMILGLLISVTN
ncbi:hypothetical protein FGIG_07435 [Fasciola gigantica]|uniref:Uncharacterized protein n=1 Tax=Fasciola gigantica TaxID=46835 RepID=A0A504YFE1_FASGI|nr:hypothetical protein FGIG_07435 [Fasciola gigantica]